MALVKSDNLRMPDIFLPDALVRQALGLGGNGKAMVEVPIDVSLTDNGARCSTLRLKILRAIRTIGESNSKIVLVSEIAQAVGVSAVAVEEHLAALKRCDCVNPNGWMIKLTAKGFQKVAMADFAARQAEGQR